MYDTRTNELNELFKAASEGATDVVKRAFENAIKNAGNEAKSAFEAMIDFSEKASAGNLGTQRKWQDRCETAKANISKAYADIAKDHVMTPAMQLFCYQSMEHEMKLFDSLKTVPTPQLHDDLLVHQDVLNKMLGELADKWRFLLEKHKTFSTDQQRAIQEVVTIAKSILNEMEGLKVVDQKARELTAAVAGVAKTISEKTKNLAPEFVKKLFEDQALPQSPNVDPDSYFSVLETYYASTAGQIERSRGQIAAYRALVSAEKGSVLLMFNDTRKDVRNYLDKNNIEIAKGWNDQARGKLADWVNSLPTNGQRTDAGKFKEKIEAAIETDWKLTQELDQKFKKEFEGVFIGVLGSKTIEELAEEVLFNKFVDQVGALSLPGKAQEMQRALPAAIDAVSGDGMRPLEEEAAKVPEEARALALMKTAEFKEYVRSKMKVRIEKTLPIFEDVVKMFSPDNLKKEFSREELINELK